jgi:NAD(P)H-hydrate repair Nnr-like enzyme with NAD(P)H-hydrate dehydratase domain
MVRYLGAPRPTDFVLARRPEVVAGAGRVQAWLIGSGMGPADNEHSQVRVAIAESLPTVLDAGSLGLHADCRGPVVLTPHAGELAELLGVEREEVVADPGSWAVTAAGRLGATVLLKGHVTFVAGPGITLAARTAPTWLATAGAGDVLGGILGALLATHASAIAADERMLARLAATAAVIHGLAASRASAGGPLTALDVATEVSATVAALLR